jgi:hypothetical protein
VNCGTPIERGKRVSSQAQRCPACHRLHRRRALLPAYLSSAEKVALEFGLDELAIELQRIALRVPR